MEKGMVEGMGEGCAGVGCNGGASPLHLPHLSHCHHYLQLLLDYQVWLAKQDLQKVLDAQGQLDHKDHQVFQEAWVLMDHQDQQEHLFHKFHQHHQHVYISDENLSRCYSCLCSTSTSSPTSFTSSNTITSFYILLCSATLCM